MNLFFFIFIQTLGARKATQSLLREKEEKEQAAIDTQVRGWGSYVTVIFAFCDIDCESDEGYYCIDIDVRNRFI